MNKLMNPREAIIELNRLKTGVRTPTDFDRRDRAIETAKAALNEQVMKKPINQKGRYGGKNRTGNCPVCAERVNSAFYIRCRHCGQRLDWSE